jgi:hypothetical protein
VKNLVQFLGVPNQHGALYYSANKLLARPKFLLAKLSVIFFNLQNS